MQRQETWEIFPTELQMIIAKQLNIPSIIRTALSSKSQILMRVVALQLTLQEAATSNISVDDGLGNKININLTSTGRNVIPVTEMPAEYKSLDYSQFSLSLDGNKALIIRSPDQTITLQNAIIQHIIPAKHPFFIDTNGSLWTLGTKENDRIILANLNNINDLSLVKFEDINNIESFLVCRNQFFVIQKNGQAWMQGHNINCEIGLNIFKTELPRKIEGLILKDIVPSSLHTIFIHQSGRVSISGHSGFNNRSVKQPPTLVNNLVNIQKVFAGKDQIFFADDQGKIKVCGLNKFCTLGIDTHQEMINLMAPIDIFSKESFIHVSPKRNVTHFFHRSGRTFFSDKQHPVPTLDTTALATLATKQTKYMQGLRFTINDLISLSKSNAPKDIIFYHAASNILLCQSGQQTSASLLETLNQSPHNKIGI